MTYPAPPSDDGSSTSEMALDLLMKQRGPSAGRAPWPTLQSLKEDLPFSSSSEAEDEGGGDDDDDEDDDDNHEDDADGDATSTELAPATGGDADDSILPLPPKPTALPAPRFATFARPGSASAAGQARPLPTIPGYTPPRGASADDVKRDLLYQFDRLEKKGYKLHRRFTMASNIDDMAREYDRVLRDKKVDAAVRFQQTCLMGFVTGVELLNNRFDPFDLRLDGWSENVHAQLNDYDDTFEELANKYSGSGSMAPEVKLLMSVVGSAFMFHMTKKLADVAPGIEAMFKANPQLQRDFAGTAAAMAGAAPSAGAAQGGLGGLGGLMSGLFGSAKPAAQSGKAADPQPAMRGPAPARAGPAPQSSAAADVLNFMRTSSTPAAHADPIEVLSQSDTSEISGVVSVGAPRRRHRNTMQL